MIQKLVYLFVINCAYVLAIDFRVINPLKNSQWISGSMMDIRWKMDNVSLPYDGVRVKIDLYKYVYGSRSFMRTIVSAAENNGLYEWPVVNDATDTDTFEIVISSSSQNSEGEHRPGVSGYFKSVQPSPANIAINIDSPQVQSTFYSGQRVNIGWSKLYPLPDFQYGLYADLMLDSRSVASIARNVSAQSDSGIIEWTVGDNYPLSTSTQSYNLVNNQQGGEFVFTGKLMLWGFDVRNDKIVYGTQGPMYVDYTDKIPLAISFVSINQGDFWYMGAKVTIVLQLAEKERAKAVQRDVKIELGLYNNDNERVDWILQPGSLIKESEWKAGSAFISYVVPEGIKLESLQSLVIDSNKQQHTFSDEKKPKTFYLHFDAEYAAKEPGKWFRIDGNSPVFNLKPLQKERGPGGSASSLQLSALSNVVCILSVLLYLLV